jgi:hypothetical protein
MKRGLNAEGFSAAGAGSKSSSFGVLESRAADGNNDGTQRSED